MSLYDHGLSPPTSFGLILPGGGSEHETKRYIITLGLAST